MGRYSTPSPESSPTPSEPFSLLSDSALSIRSKDSMVEIIQHPQKTDSPGVHKLLYSKSKVYVHPTAFSRDNIPGYVSIVKKDGLVPTYLLAWIPESLLNKRGQEEIAKFATADGGLKQKGNTTDEEDGVLIDPFPPQGESYAFSVPLSSIYSLVVTAPSLSSWYGSITINLVNGSTLPTLHFHDDESKRLPTRPSTTTNGLPGLIWGGEDLMQRLRNYCHILKSSIQSNLFLIDPSRSDIDVHSTPLFDDIDFSSTSPVPYHRRPQRGNAASSPPNDGNRTSVLHESFSSPSSARMALLSGFSQFTRATRHAAQNILSHPLAKPILPHLPSPVRSIVNVQGEYSSWVEKGGMGEYESARVYLARWARVIAEEGERARQREALSHGTGNDSREASDLGVFELLAETANLPTPRPTRDPKLPIDAKKWDSWFYDDGRPKISFEDFRREVFCHGISPPLRRKAWPLLLGVVPWDASSQDRGNKWAELRSQYEEVKSRWCGVDEVFNSPEIIEERHRIDVDCRRTDRTHPMFSMQTAATSTGSSIAVGSEVGAHTLANEHVENLSVVLLTYHLYEKELGYVQGMSDLLSPIYVVCDTNEVESFWCFVSVMERTKRNFLRDQSGMKSQLHTLQELLKMMDPELYRHFEKTDALNLFFCYRWILISFKREFPFDAILGLWECLWSNYYSKQFVLFVALAVLESHRDVILRYLVEFDEVLKYCNDLSMTIELDSTLAQAEVLFLSFSQIVADLDRRKAEAEGKGSTTMELRRRRVGTSSSASTSTIRGNSSSGGQVTGGGETQTFAFPVIEDCLRELLV